MATIKLRRKTYWASVWVPLALRPQYGGKTHLERTLKTSDRRIAEREAAAWEALVKREFDERATGRDNDAAALRRVYEQTRAAAEGGAYQVRYRTPPTDDLADPTVAGIDMELDRLADRVGERDLTEPEQARVDALQDALETARGKAAPLRQAYEQPFSAIVTAHMKQWRVEQSGKETNTEQQKLATFRLFEGFWKDRPIRGIRTSHAATFHDKLRLLNPAWARSPAARKLSWDALQRTFGDHDTGLSDGTMNRHMATLAALWDWARKRGHCEGDNPFEGFHRRLRTGVNVAQYLPWETQELSKLLAPAPTRTDLLEVMLVGMHTGMRLNEIASLTWGHLRTQDGTDYFQIEDAKTPAGNRQVPLHPALGWLKERREGKQPGARIWTEFNPEGPGKKPGADAGKEFSRFKASRGFKTRVKAFHSFRKNVTRIMERSGVPENEWAQVFGHEKGFTYGRYNPDGITLERKAAIIALIDYPDLELPTP